jgi:plasmid stabilization system protein ParE
MKIVVRPVVNDALLDAIVWHLDRGNDRVAFALEAAFEAALDQIAAMPRRFPPVENSPNGREFRECYLVRFQYRMIFELNNDEIRVSAFVHTKQHQRRWLNQLESE